jgi:hypothetical protein
VVAAADLLDLSSPQPAAAATRIVHQHATRIDRFAVVTFT